MACALFAAPACSVRGEYNACKATTCVKAGAAACGKEGWKVAELNGAPCLFRDGRPVAPIMFWQWEMEEQDAKALAGAGVDLFGVFG
ncbi:MAG: hypothetical protein K6F50_01580, partial [Kiritimatiellae bacterium]|nr:hypothetical protein [Kiritimatiellia bacterium]